MRPLYSPTSLFFLTIACILCLLPVRPAGAAGHVKTSPHTTGGYCGVHGRIIRADAANCKKQHGVFFRDRKAAQNWLADQEPGFCCANGKVSRTKKGDCAKRKGAFFKTKKEADYYCDRHRKGFCCTGGRVLFMEKGTCRDKRGKFFAGKHKAAGYCTDHQDGFCCQKGTVRAMKKGLCERKKGFFFKGRKAAADYCEQHRKGFCCMHGKVLAMEKQECIKKKGKFSATRQAAGKLCEQKGWCIVHGRLVQTSRPACRKQRGRFFTSRIKAAKALANRKPGRTPAALQIKPGSGGTSHVKPFRRAATTESKTVAPAAKPMHGMKSRAAITISRIYLKKNIIQVQLRKSGTGPVDRKALNRAILTLAAGTAHKKWPMNKVDPHRNLANGKMVIFDTGIHITGKTRIKAALTRMAGNPQKTAWLAPLSDRSATARMQTVKPGKTTTISPLVKPMRTAGNNAKPAETSKPARLGPVAATIVQDAAGKPSPVPKRFNGGVLILQPTAGTYFPGQEISVEYRLPDRSGEGITSLTVELRKEGETGFSRNIELARVNSEAETRLSTWVLPSDLDGGSYYVAVSLGDGVPYGYSDRFTIRRFSLEEMHAISKSTVILSPDYQSYEPGESFTLIVHGSGTGQHPYAAYLSARGSSNMGFWHLLWGQEDGLRSESDGYRMDDLRMPSSVNDEVEAWEVVVQNEAGGFTRSHSFEIIPGVASTRGHFGEGGASDTTPHIWLASPRTGDYLPDDDTMRTIPIRWTYHGPAGTCPYNWHIRLRQEGHPDREYDTIRPDHREEQTPDIPGLNHTWTMRRDMFLSIPPGEYSLTISADGFTADSGGTFYLGHDTGRPELLLRDGPATGSRYFPGDTIEMAWFSWPGFEDTPRYWPRISCGGRIVDMGNEPENRRDELVMRGYRSSRATVTINPEATPSTDCRVVIRSTIPRGLEASGNQFSILPTPVGGLDIAIRSFRIDENGHLIADIHTRGLATAVTVPFFIGSSDADREPGHLTRVIHEIESSDLSHIDLGHINTMVNAEKRRRGPKRWITVKVNMPETVVPEHDFTNNSQRRWIEIRPVHLERNHMQPCYSHRSGGSLTSPPDFSCPGHVVEGGVADADLVIINHGWSRTPITGRVLARIRGTTQCRNRGERQHAILDDFSVSVRNTSYSGHLATIHVEDILNRSGTLIREGEISLHFSGDLGQLRDVQIPLHCR